MSVPFRLFVISASLLAKDLEQYNIPFAFIDKDAYGAIDGAATLKQAMDVLKGAKPQEVEKEPVKEVEKKEVKADKNVENQKGFWVGLQIH